LLLGVDANAKIAVVNNTTIKHNKKKKEKKKKMEAKKLLNRTLLSRYFQEEPKTSTPLNTRKKLTGRV
jgi:hypothetical protein